MSTADLLLIVQKRGLRVELEDGQPILKRPKGNEGVTDALLAVLKRHRDRIIELLSKKNGVP